MNCPRSPTHHRSPRHHAFTLLEVALAIVITVGLLLAVMTFYRQTTQLRQNLLDETEQIASIRLVLERLTTELRSARPHTILLTGLTGTSNSIHFICTAPPTRSAWQRDSLGRSFQPQSDLTEISYELAGSGDLTEATGLIRSQGPVTELIVSPDQVANPNAESDTTAGPANSPGSDPFFNPNPEPSLDDTTRSDLDSMDETPSEVMDPTTTVEGGIREIRELLSSQIRFMSFRYWDGLEWRDSWYDFDLPMAVEVTLGGPPWPKTENPEEAELGYPYEFFRRIIALPGPRIMDLSFDFLLETAAPESNEPSGTESDMDAEVFP